MQPIIGRLRVGQARIAEILKIEDFQTERMSTLRQLFCDITQSRNGRFGPSLPFEAMLRLRRPPCWGMTIEGYLLNSLHGSRTHTTRTVEPFTASRRFKPLGKGNCQKGERKSVEIEVHALLVILPETLSLIPENAGNIGCGGRI